MQDLRDKTALIGKLIEKISQPVTDSNGKIIGFDECLIPGITFVEQGENNSSKYVEFHFDDGECWTFTRQNSEDVSEDDDEDTPESVAHEEVYSARMISIPPECHPKPRTNI